jgi:hypothetical protein
MLRVLGRCFGFWITDMYRTREAVEFGKDFEIAWGIRQSGRDGRENGESEGGVEVSEVRTGVCAAVTLSWVREVHGGGVFGWEESGRGWFV